MKNTEILEFKFKDLLLIVEMVKTIS